jgi:hypothetical protein
MRLYVTPAGRWAGTQAAAKALCKEHGEGGFEQFEVPTDKDGLLTFLNCERVKAMHEEAVALVETPSVIPLSPAAARPDYTRDFTATEIEDFVLNRATVAQVENIFAALGTRFAEKRAA